MPKKSKPVPKSKVVTTLSQLETQLREDGFRGTQRVMRLLKALRASLEETGSYSWAEEPTDFTSSLNSIT